MKRIVLAIAIMAVAIGTAHARSTKGPPYLLEEGTWLCATPGDYDQAIAINPKDFNSFNSRGKAWVAKGDSTRAITDFTQAIHLNPSYVEAYNNRGLSYEALGRRAEAIADFRKVQSIDSTDRVSKQQLRILGF